MFTYSDDTFSDLHKDVYGFRPRGGLWDQWHNRTPRQKQELWNALCDELEENTKAEKAEEVRAIDKFESRVQDVIGLGARNFLSRPRCRAFCLGARYLVYRLWKKASCRVMRNC